MRVIGMGSGRCGTQTLARMLGCTHEPNPKLPWDISEEKIKHHVNNDESAVALYFGRYWQFFDDDTRFIVLKRDKKETIESFMAITEGRNHWSEPQNELWDMCFPSYEDMDKRDAIEKYYDEYYKMMPRRALWVRTKDLSEKETQKSIYDYAKIPEDQRIYANIVANQRQDHVGYKG